MFFAILREDPQATSAYAVGQPFRAAARRAPGPENTYDPPQDSEASASPITRTSMTRTLSS